MMPRARQSILAVVIAIIVVAVPARGDASTPRTLEVAAASDLRFALREIAGPFERVHDVRVRVSFGSSGQLAAQIQQGAPFDLFFSADESLVRGLAARGAVRGESIRIYAIGRIVVWVRAASPVDVSTGLGVLTASRVRYIAIANPTHAPYGRAAEQALKFSGIYDAVRPKLVLAENIIQALQFVQSGNADAGIVALSLAVAPPVKNTGRYWLLPAALHAPIRQAVGITTRSRQAALAGAFIAYVNSTSGRDVMRRYGFE